MVPSSAGFDSQVRGLAAGASLAGLKGALIALSLPRSAGVGFCGICSSTGAGSILSWRQALEARARANVRSGNSSYSPASRASSLRTGTFSAAARAAMCRPAASRAWRNNTGRLTAAGDSRV